MKYSKTILIWSITIAIVLFVVIYQRMTGPTYPDRGNKEVYGKIIKYSLPRSNDGAYEVKVSLNDDSKQLKGFVNFKRYKSYDEWSQIELLRDNSELFFIIPNQPAAGKVMYHIYLTENEKQYIPLTEQPVILRFRDPVPNIVITLHVLFIFASILFSNRAGIEALLRGNKVKLYAWLTIITLILGGFVFGPIMQKYAFGAFWTGFPFGYDLTDNKTLIAFVFWFASMFFMYFKKDYRISQIIASIMLIIIFLIPHSLLGSEIDYTKTEPKIEDIKNLEE